MFELARHKLHPMGGSLVIAIPKRWSKNTGLKRGDTLSCYVNHKGDLVIKPVKEVEM